MSNTNPRAYLMRRLMADLYTLGFVLDARWPRVLILIHSQNTQKIHTRPSIFNKCVLKSVHATISCPTQTLGPI